MNARFSARPPLLTFNVRRQKATRKETLMSEKKAPGKLAPANGTQESARSPTRQAAKNCKERVAGGARQVTIALIAQQQTPKSTTEPAQ